MEGVPLFLFICFHLTLKSLMFTNIIHHYTIHGSFWGQGVLDGVPQKSGPKTKWEFFIENMIQEEEMRDGGLVKKGRRKNHFKDA